MAKVEREIKEAGLTPTATHALIQSEARLRQVVESAPNAMVYIPIKSRTKGICLICHRSPISGCRMSTTWIVQVVDSTPMLPSHESSFIAGILGTSKQCTCPADLLAANKL